MIMAKVRKARAHAGVFLRGKLYDWKHGVDTTSIVPISQLSVLGGNAPSAIQYEPVSPDELKSTLAEIDVRFDEHTFIDFGSGKGRVLLMAAAYPFRKIIGVEFAKELHQIALSNVNRYRGLRRCHDIECIHADATEFAIPPGPLVIFLNNPFRDPVMSRVIQNVWRSIAADPRDVLFVCVTRWTVTKHIESMPGVREVRTIPIGRIYRFTRALPIKEQCAKLN
jgi:hypothetical protein